MGAPEIILIIIAILLLFGGKKIPQLMRGLGEGMKSFKDAKGDTETTAAKE
jgi:sec-independent protein translocase protein TatA